MLRYSVILPAYNAEAFVEKAIRSALSPGEDYEILVVDDGSTDGTYRLLQRLAEEIPVLRVFRKENAGPAEARNFGLEKARGEYVLFCDSDDRFTPDGPRRAVELCRESGADVLIFGFLLSQGGESVPYRYRECLLASEKDWQEHLAPLYVANQLNQVWGKVFRRSLLTEPPLRFPPALWGEDRLFFFSALRRAARVQITGECFYDYIQHENSLISRFLPEKGELCRQVHREITALAEEKGALNEATKPYYSYMYVKSLLSAFATLFSPGTSLSRREKRAYLAAILRQEEIRSASRFPADCGGSFRILASVMRTGNVTLNYLASWGIRLVSVLAPGRLRRAKHAYNQNQEKGE